MDNKIVDIADGRKLNWFILSDELPNECYVKALNPRDAMTEAIRLYPCIKTITCVMLEDDDIEWEDSESDIPEESEFFPPDPRFFIGQDDPEFMLRKNLFMAIFRGNGTDEELKEIAKILRIESDVEEKRG